MMSRGCVLSILLWGVLSCVATGCAQLLGIEDLPDLGDAGNELNFDASVPMAPDVGDNMAPVVEIVFPPARSLTDAETVTLRGTASDADGVAALRVNGMAVSVVNEDGRWQVTVPLVRGENELVIESEDELGNVGVQAAEIVVEQSANILRNSVGVAWDPVGERVLVVDNSLDALLERQSV